MLGWYNAEMEEAQEIQEASEAVKSKKIYFLPGDSRRNRGELLQPDKKKKNLHKKNPKLTTNILCGE